MSISSSARAAPNPLARIAFVLAPGRPRRGWIAGCALVVAALLAGAGASHLYWRERVGAAQPRQPTAAVTDLQPLQLALEQARLQMRVSEAHGHELERQIDALNQRLRECQDELTFFRKARDAKR